MNQALYANMNNKRKMKKKKRHTSTKFGRWMGEKDFISDMVLADKQALIYTNAYRDQSLIHHCLHGYGHLEGGNFCIMDCTCSGDIEHLV
jgi:hypothetical protein